MGKQKNTSLRGTFGNLIFYNHMGIDCVRSLSGKKNRKTPAMKHTMAAFGKGSTIAAFIFSHLQSMIASLAGSTERRRLENAVRSWLRSERDTSDVPVTGLPFITGFEFNEGNELLPRVHRLPLRYIPAEEGLTIDIAAYVPASTIAAPSSTTAIEWMAGLVCIPVDEPQNTTAATYNWNVPYTDEPVSPQHIFLQANLQKGTLSVLVLQAVFEKKGVSLEHLDRAAAVVWSQWG